MEDEDAVSMAPHRLSCVEGDNGGVFSGSLLLLIEVKCVAALSLVTLIAMIQSSRSCNKVVRKSCSGGMAFVLTVTNFLWVVEKFGNVSAVKFQSSKKRHITQCTRVQGA